jgi:hypothetical protein
LSGLKIAVECALTLRYQAIGVLNFEQDYGVSAVQIERLMLRRIFLAVALTFFAMPRAGRAEVPSDLFGRWSTDPNSCVDDPGPGVTVLSVDAAEVGWYEYGCSIIRSTPSADGVNLAIDCVKGGGSQHVGSLNIRRDGRNRITVESNVGGLGDRFRRCDSSRHTSPNPAFSCWVAALV